MYVLCSVHDHYGTPLVSRFDDNLFIYCQPRQGLALSSAEIVLVFVSLGVQCFDRGVIVSDNLCDGIWDLVIPGFPVRFWYKFQCFQIPQRRPLI